MAAQILEVISKDEKERMIYEDQLLYEADRLAELRYAIRTSVEAAEGSKALEIAANFKRDKFPLEAIVKNTGISLDVLKTL